MCLSTIIYTEALGAEVQRDCDIRHMIMMYTESMNSITEALEDALLYGETEGGGFFSKIAVGIKNVVKGMIEFVSKIISSILGFVLRPFGIKLKVKESSGGGGGGSSSSSSSSSSTPSNGMDIEVQKDKTMEFQNGKFYNMSFFNIPHTPTIVSDYINALSQEGKKELGKTAKDKIWMKVINLSDKERKKITLSGSNISPNEITTAMNVFMGKIRPVAAKLNKYTAYRFNDSVSIKDEAKFVSDNMDMNVYMNAIKGDANKSFSAEKIFDFGNVQVVSAGAKTGQNIRAQSETMVNIMSLFIHLLKGVDIFMERSTKGGGASYVNVRRSVMNTFVNNFSGVGRPFFAGIRKQAISGDVSVKEILAGGTNSIGDPILKKVTKRYLGLATDQLTPVEGSEYVIKVLDCGIKSYNSNESIRLINDMKGFTPFDFKNTNKMLAGQKTIVDKARKVTEKDIDNKNVDKAMGNPKAVVGQVREDLDFMRDSLQNLTSAHGEFNDMILAIQSSQMMPYTICTVIEYDVYIRNLGSLYAVASDRYNQTEGSVKDSFKKVMTEIDRNYKLAISMVKGS